MHETVEEHEQLALALNDPERRAEYARPYDHYRPNLAASMLGWLLVTAGNVVYGHRPSYLKFKAVEIIARIPYQSWEVASYSLLTHMYSNEKKAIELAKTSAFSRIAQDNETMHVVVISQLCKKRGQGFIRHYLIPLAFAFFYFGTSYILYLVSRKTALQLNYLFESHAYQQYSEFLEIEGERLKHSPIMSEFLHFYGRHVRTEYEFFELVRNDELIHRNRSIKEIELRQ